MGKHTIPMVELKALYEKMGFKSITTYIQSGNVIFLTKDNVHLSINKIREGILEKYGYTIPILIRTVDEMQSAVETNPFLKRKGINMDKLHVTFLSEISSKEHLEKIKMVNFPPDEFVIIEKEIYISCPNGYGNSKLSNTFFENKLKVTATTRNWRTVNELLRIARELK